MSMGVSELLESRDTILIVDDDIYNLDILEKYLQRKGYKTQLAESGREALDLLGLKPCQYSLILLDWIMPGIDGIEVLEQIKAHEDLKYIPVIMQTSASMPEEISYGISKGVYYYLTKPFSREVLLSIVGTAIQDYTSLLALKERLMQNRLSMKHLNKAEFSFQTIEEGMTIVNLLAHMSRDPMKTGIGLKELVVNAIEHGNLQITYNEKSQLLREDRWEEEIERRQNLPNFKRKRASLYVEKVLDQEEGSSFLEITIRDQGEGFQWEEYIGFSMDRIYDLHGRGILMARNSFSKLDYKERGRTVSVLAKAL